MLMAKTKIEWADATWSPVTGCSPVSTGCKNCFAKRMAKRLAGRFGYPEAPHEFDVTLHEDKLEQPLRWKKPRMIFVVSMGDLFHEDVPSRFIKRDVWNVMVDAKQHIFQLLTKRPDRMLALLGNHTPWPSNVWAGTSVENADHLWRVEKLLQCPAAVHFVSLEPLLAPIDIRQYLFERLSLSTHPARIDWKGTVLPALNWTIIGGESGPGARPMNPQWARDIVVQCQEANVPAFVKQMGTYWAKYEEPDGPWCTSVKQRGDTKGTQMEYWPEALRVREMPEIA